MAPREELIDRLVAQLAGVFRGRDPREPRTRYDIKEAISRARLLTERLASEPAPWPDAPRSEAFSEGDGEEILERVMERLTPT
jgi:hypothetical protein